MFELIGGPKDGDHISYDKRLYVWVSENDVGVLYERDGNVYRFSRYLTVIEVESVYEERGVDGSTG